jgi:hypothetical protein
MSRQDILKALCQRLQQIDRLLPPMWQHQARLQAHEAAQRLLRQQRDQPHAGRSWR